MGMRAQFLKGCTNRLFLQTKSSFINAILNLQLDSPFVPQTRKQWYQTNIFSVKKNDYLSWGHFLSSEFLTTEF